jgi:hypothetical protein
MSQVFDVVADGVIVGTSIGAHKHVNGFESSIDIALNLHVFAVSFWQHFTAVLAGGGHGNWYHDLSSL